MRHPARIAQSLALASIPIGIAALALVLAPRARAIDLPHASAAPSLTHWLGTDALGRDLLARVIVAAPLSFALALIVVAVAVVGGALVGGACAIGSDRSRRWSASALSILLTFPSLLIALVIVMLLKPGGVSAALAIGIAMIPGFARTTQMLAIAIADSDFMAAARLLGVSPARRFWRHLLPHIAGPLAVKAAADAGQALIIVAGFSFLGFGVQAPDYDWGRMLAQGLKGLYVTPLPALAPGVAVALAGLACSALCDRLAGAKARISHAAPSVPASRVQLAPTTGPQQSLTVRGLTLRHPGGTIISDLDLDLHAGEILGLVGESGSGKTSLALAIAGLSAPVIEVKATRLAIAGKDLNTLTAQQRAAWLGRRIGFVFQDALSAFNPLIAVGRQIAERLEVHGQQSPAVANSAAVAALVDVGLSDPPRQARQRPAALSGGMRQRALIAMGLVVKPDLLIADEPTTALDTTVQAQVLDLLRAAAADGCSVLFVSHDLPVVAQLCTRIAVLYAGRIVEILAPADLRPHGPRHPYTRALVSCVPWASSPDDDRLAVIPGAVSPDDAAAPGCAFAPRCDLAQANCRTQRPSLGHNGVACWHPYEVRT